MDYEGDRNMKRREAKRDPNLLSRLGEWLGKHRGAAKVVAGVAVLVALVGASFAANQNGTSRAEAATAQASGISDSAVKACLREATSGPDLVSGIVEKNGRNARLGVIYGTDARGQHCQDYTERTFKTWYMMQNNKRKFKKNSKTIVAVTGENEYYGIPNGKVPAGTGKYAGKGGKVPLQRRYTCMPGKKKRGLRVVNQVTATYEGVSMTKKYRSNKVISPRYWKYGNTGKTKC